MKYFSERFKALAFMMLGVWSLNAQEPTHPQYVRPKANSEAFETLYNSWQPGRPYSTQHADDEEFYISRVKPRPRFNNGASQVFPSLDPDRKFLFWVPAGQNGTGDNQWNALPTYMYDSEVFNMWSYVDHYGNWTANLIRMPGAFADICHKNGVTTSVVAAIPWAANITGTDEQGGKGLKALMDGGATKLLQFLRYYGIDGIGLNSEFNFSTPALANNFRTFLKNAAVQRNSANWPTYSAVWYNLMTNAGKVAMGTDGSGGFLGTGTSDWFHSSGEVTNHFFLNYPWTETTPSTATTYLTNSQTRAEALGRSSYDVYAGVNMQGASRVWLPQLSQRKISLGVWGAHNMNMIFENRNRNGAAPDIQQNTYMVTSEQFFTGGSQNPINSPALTEKFGANDAFGGISKLITERSSLQGNLGAEPFVTYFNLGNGKFFNFQGVTTFPKEWYNIGMQDYLPTWRWWISNTFMGRDAASVPSGLKAKFTWDDAWFGGSCMSISGTNSGNGFIHLFKTKYVLQNGDKLKIRYKVIEGSADLKWALSVEGNENSASSIVIADKTSLASNKNKWVEKEIVVGTNGFLLNGETLAVMAINVADAENLKLLLGEVSLVRNVAATPQVPTVKKAVSLAYSHKGADFKLIYKMNGGSGNAADPVYNSDVNTWYFKIYSQQEGESPILCTTTTSWAAYVVGAPVKTDGIKRVRYGVSAVSLDGNSESAISWTGYSELPAVTIDETIVIDKPVIKAHENFTLKYVDPYHGDAEKWEIISQADGLVKASKTGGKSITAQLSEVGIYDAKVTSNGLAKTMRGLIQISGPEVGALPEIYTLTANGSETSIDVQKLTNVNFAYTGRNADGYVSRGLRLPEKPFRIPIDQLGLVDRSTSFSLSFWFKADDFPAGVTTQMVNIRDVNGSWPANNWGYVWNNIYQGQMSMSVRQQYANGGTEMNIIDKTYRFESKVWTHLSYVFTWSGGQMGVKLYVNGKLFGTINPTSDVYSLNPTKTSLMIGGTAAGRGGLNGVIDEVQFYNKALSEAEVVRSMSHFEQNELPANLIAYFDFETTPSENNQLLSTGTNTALWAETSGQSPKPGGNEGETIFTPEASVFAPGAPFIPGSVFKIETLPVWNFGEGEVVSSGGNGEGGDAVVRYATDGQYSAVLTLKNGWGADSRTFQYVVVQTPTGIGDVEGIETNVYPNPFADEVNVLFKDGGSYRIDVYNIGGQNILSKNLDVDGGEFVKIRVNAPKGTYMMKISNHQQVVKSLKLIKY